MSTIAERHSANTLRDLPTVSATTLKNSIGDVFEKLAAASAVVISRHEKPHAVLLSVDEYDKLSAYRSNTIRDLEEEYYRMFKAQDTPEGRARMARLMNATSEELGEAAVRGARTKTPAHAS